MLGTSHDNDNCCESLLGLTLKLRGISGAKINETKYFMLLHYICTTKMSLVEIPLLFTLKLGGTNEVQEG